MGILEISGFEPMCDDQELHHFNDERICTDCVYEVYYSSATGIYMCVDNEQFVMAKCNKLIHDLKVDEASDVRFHHGRKPYEDVSPLDVFLYGKWTEIIYVT